MPPKSPLKPSTADSGFVLSPGPLSNPFTSDQSFQRVLSWYLPARTLDAVKPNLTRFGDEAISTEVKEWISNAERSPPYVKQYNVWGERNDPDRLVTSWGWREAGKWGIANGVVAHGYEDGFGCYRRIVQHAHSYIYSASSAVYSCPVSMTSGAARLFQHQSRKLPPNHPFHEIFRRLTARTNNWISAQWMTERPGGSDVQNTETVAIYSPLEDTSSASDTAKSVEEGDYLVSGFKFFSSATDCNVALMLAKTSSGKLSLFVAPTRLTTTDPLTGQTKQISNGIRIHRLKTKYGTKPLPTAELILTNVRAHLVGELDRGVPTIATLLNVTRTHNFITAMSCWRRSMHITKAFARARTTIDQPLWLFPMHLRLLANMEVKHAGCLQLCFFTTALLSFIDNGYPSDISRGYAPLPKADDEIKIVLRTLTATSKAVVCKVATNAMWECAEAMGGVGYMDEPDEPEWNIVRLMRDTAANMTWEGTTNVLASEVVRHLLKAGTLGIWEGWLRRSIEGVEDEEMKETLLSASRSIHNRLTANRDLREVLAEGREIMFSLAWVASGMLLCHDAQRDSDVLAVETAKRWVLDGEGGLNEFVIPEILKLHGHVRAGATQRANWDCRLAWGVDLPENAATGYRVERGDSKL